MGPPPYKRDTEQQKKANTATQQFRRETEGGLPYDGKQKNKHSAQVQADDEDNTISVLPEIIKKNIVEKRAAEYSAHSKQ